MKYSVLTGSIGILVGLGLFLNSETLIGFLIPAILTITISASLGLIVDSNLSNKGKVSVIVLILMITAGLTIPNTLLKSCPEIYESNPDIGQHPFTGETVSVVYTGNGCAREGLAWYYQELKENEIRDYCEMNTKTGYCILRSHEEAKISGR
jgi:hypothetical protein